MREAEKLRDDGLGGIERFCVRCKEYWPATFEYFIYVDPANKIFHSYCRACHYERGDELRKQKRTTVAA